MSNNKRQGHNMSCVECGFTVAKDPEESFPTFPFCPTCQEITTFQFRGLSRTWFETLEEPPQRKQVGE